MPGRMVARSVEAEIGLCLLLAAVDGEISEKEIGALSTRVGVLLGDDFNPMGLPAILERELGSIGNLGVDDYVAKLPERIAEPRRFEAVRAAIAVACSDGLAQEEEEIVRQVCKTFALDPETLLAAGCTKQPRSRDRSPKPDERP